MLLSVAVSKASKMGDCSHFSHPAKNLENGSRQKIAGRKQKSQKSLKVLGSLSFLFAVRPRPSASAAASGGVTFGDWEPGAASLYPCSLLDSGALPEASPLAAGRRRKFSRGMRLRTQGCRSRSDGSNGTRMGSHGLCLWVAAPKQNCRQSRHDEKVRHCSLNWRWAGNVRKQAAEGNDERSR